MPSGMTVAPLNGNLYVADTGNHRVLRYSDPFANTQRVEPDAVYGQPGMNGKTAGGSGNARNGLRSPVAIPIDRQGNLWIADSGNNRVLRYPAAGLDSSSPAADLVIGQKDLNDTGRNRSGNAVVASGFDVPVGLAFDSDGNLYISDSANGRVLRFTPPFTIDSAASVSVQLPPGRTAIAGGVSVANGNLYVALPKEHRVLVYSQPVTATATPASVYGQSDLTGRDANAGVYPRAAAYTLSEPADVKPDADGNLYIADTGNNRVLRFRARSRSADRAWGQLDFASNAVNQAKASGLNGPSKIAIDYGREPFVLYVCDANNHRVLIWKAAARFRTGDAADAVIGQADLQSAFANFDGGGGRPTANSLSSPRGIAVDGSGNLYVADTENNRVLRFPRPADQFGIRTADLLLGQPDFTTGGTSVASATAMRAPTSIAVAPDQGIFVAGTGNNRVLEFAPGVTSNPAAIRVYGQPGFEASAGAMVVSAQTLTAPMGIAVDMAFNLYVADSGANRIIIYPNTRDAAPASNASVLVIGSDAFDRVAAGSSRTRLNAPADVALDSAGNIYVADSRNHRIAVFPSLIFLPITDGAAAQVIGQADFNGNAQNGNSSDGAATSEALAAPAGIFIDRWDTLYVADSGNHRVLHFLKASRIVHTVYRQASSLARGGLVTIEGDGLADTDVENAAPLPQTTAEREVVVQDTWRAPLVSVARSKIMLQMPSNAPLGSSRVAVRVIESDELIAGGPVTVSAYSPGLFAKVVNTDGSANGDSNAAVRGTTIRLTGAGQGPAQPAISDGDTAPDSSVVTVPAPVSDGNACLTGQPSVCVSIGNTFRRRKKFLGLAGGSVGVWQLDVRIPENAPVGNAPVRAVINAVPSNIVNVAIR